MFELLKVEKIIFSKNLRVRIIRVSELIEDIRYLQFDVDDSAVPENFLQAEVTVDGKRHIIFSTPVQLNYLASTKCLFVDGTFDVIKTPFTQLYSFRGFLKVGELVTIAGHSTGHSRCRYLKGCFCLELIRAVNQFC